MWTRKELKEKAKAAFRNNYWVCVVVALILGVISGASGGISASSSSQNMQNLDPETAIAIGVVLLGITTVISLLSIFVFNPLKVGGCRFFKVNAEETADIGEIGYAFKRNYGNSVLTMFLTGLFIVLWSLLLIIPGIIKSYSYRMVPYILSDNPDLGAMEVIDRSKQMMSGNKWDTFLLDLSFIGWILFGIVTFGIGMIFWVSPYIRQTEAELYLAISGNSRGYSQPSYDYNPGGYIQEPVNRKNYEDDIEPMIPLE